MTLILPLHQLTGLLVPLGESALRSLAVAGLAALVMALHSPKRAGVRLQIWTGVLYIALAMPLLGIILPRVNVAIPRPAWLSARVSNPSAQLTTPEKTQVASAAPNFGSERAQVQHEATHSAKQQRVTPTLVSTSDSKSYAAPAAGPTIAIATPSGLMTGRGLRISWIDVVTAAYFLGLATMLLRLMMGLSASRRLARSSDDVSPKYFPRKGEVEDAHTSAALDFLARQSKLAGLKAAPHLKESAVLLVPATVGIRRPLILLPAGWRAWGPDKVEAVLAHEISHVMRRDAFTQLLSRLHCAIFWFSPLPWWLHRQITELAEQASDEAALAGGVNRKLYAETLLGFFEQLQSVRGRVRWHALSMASQSSSGHAERRVDRILAWKASTSIKKSLVVLSVACAAPVVFLVASFRPSLIAQASAPRAKEVSAASAGNKSEAKDPSFAAHAVPATYEKGTQQKAEQSVDETNTVNIHGSSYRSDSGPRYVFIQANSNSVTMSGDEEDLQHARGLRGKINGDFIWFERDEKSYVITDPAFLAHVKALFDPQDELSRQQDALGRQQDELGRQQDDLGRQQDELGKRMDAVSVKMPDISPDLERIHARLKQLQASGATQSELGSVQSQLGELQSRVGRFQSQAGQQQSVVGGQQSELGRRQSELGRKQSELGRQQSELGRQQAELARKASRELRSMFDNAITKGTAKPE